MKRGPLFSARLLGGFLDVVLHTQNGELSGPHFLVFAPDRKAALATLRTLFCSEEPRREFFSNTTKPKRGSRSNGSKTKPERTR